MGGGWVVLGIDIVWGIFSSEGICRRGGGGGGVLVPGGYYPIIGSIYMSC